MVFVAQCHRAPGSLKGDASQGELRHSQLASPGGGNEKGHVSGGSYDQLRPLR